MNAKSKEQKTGALFIYPCQRVRLLLKKKSHMNTGKEHTNKRKSESGDHVIDDTGQKV